MGAHHVPDDPYRIEIEAVDSLLPGEVAVVGTQKSLRNAPWGELLSTASKARGARGAIVDGFVRDVQKIEEIGFPVLVHPGDLVFADFDGVVVVPQAIVAEVIELASKKSAVRIVRALSWCRALTGATFSRNTECIEDRRGVTFGALPAGTGISVATFARAQTGA